MVRALILELSAMQFSQAASAARSYRRSDYDRPIFLLFPDHFRCPIFKCEIGDREIFCVCALFMTNTSKFLQINSTKS